VTTCTRNQPTSPIQPTATHRVGQARPGTLRLWTLQPWEVWDSLRRGRNLYVDLALIEGQIHDFLWAYDFMREQMAQRLPGYEGHYPWWAWRHPKPDLRTWYPHNCFLPGTHATRIELAIPADRVLLSNETAWWYVIQPNYLSAGGADLEDSGFESTAAEEAAGEEKWNRCLEWPLSAPWQFRVVPSWGRVFDLEAMERQCGNAVQATFERLELADVVAVTEFTAREIR
jgi:hypothetical protein